MKILVAQLARLGDIYQTWPALLAYQRENPSHEIHLLVREKFRGATVGLPASIRIHSLKTAEHLAPILRGEDQAENISLKSLDFFLDELREEKFQKIVNLSFSPFSSYLAHYLEVDAKVEVRGYTRFEDGYFSIPDDTSAYFYAQVGITQFNRIHLTHIFASIMGVTLRERDFRAPEVIDFGLRDGIIIQVGASEIQKRWPALCWKNLIKDLLDRTGEKITLVGSKEEEGDNNRITREFNSPRLNSLVGKTSIHEVLNLTSTAKLVVGGDSVLMHMASLTDTPCVNLSCNHVKFWETGPTSVGSQILYSEKLINLNESKVFAAVDELLNKKAPTGDYFVKNRIEPLVYNSTKKQASKEEFLWDLISAIYLNTAYPDLPDLESYKTYSSLQELAVLGLNEIEKFERSKGAHGPQLDQVERYLEHIRSTFVEVQPVVDWFLTEKIRIGPMEPENILSITKRLYRDLYFVASVYVERANNGKINFREAPDSQKI